jgi:pyridoxamine 5'-phosphate oxidase
MSIADIRREYALTGLRRKDLDPDPIQQFQKWFQQAVGARTSGRVLKLLVRMYKRVLLVTGSEPMEVNVMTLATADKKGIPSSRIVLLKGVDARGFIFFTNYGSRKGQELSENPNAALTVYWADLERQVCIAGSVIKLSQEESNAYFQTRPRGSRLGAWASRQSYVVPGRESLEKEWAQLEAKYPGDVPMPPFWGGYVVVPNRVEFWQGRPNRLHDRFRYQRQPDKTWIIERLAP